MDALHYLSAEAANVYGVTDTHDKTEPPRPASTSDWKGRLHRAVQDCIVIDLETTGLEPRSERIIEVAAVHVVNGQPVDTFHSLINPERPVPAFITDLTGISSGLVADAPSFSEVAERLHTFLSRASSPEGGSLVPLVGHNVSFDFSFLQHEFVRVSLDETSRGPLSPYTPELICTADASRALIDRERVGRYRLEKVADVLDTPHRPRHRAISDAEATADVLIALLELTDR